MRNMYLEAGFYNPEGKRIMPPRFSEHKIPGRQAGVVLFIALIALVAMTLAAIALVRSVDTGNVVAGNLAFKQGATLASDTAIETAITYLSTIADISSSYNDIVAQGYYATSQTSLDMTGSKNDANMARVDWDDNDCAGTLQTACIDPSASIDLGNGYTAKYIIHRLCSTVGLPNPNICATYEAPPSAGGASGNKGAILQGAGKIAGAKSGYYRITTRVSGPRNTTSFIETIVHF